MPPQLEQYPRSADDSWENLEGNRRRNNNNHEKNEGRPHHSASASTGGATMEQLDPFVPVERPSIFHRESFLVQFASQKGPRAIILLIVFLAMGLGSTVGVVPAVMTDRYARLHHGYDSDIDCADYNMTDKPQECLDGSADAQMASATGNLVSNVLTFITSSLMGSLSDEHGRRGVFVFIY